MSSHVSDNQMFRVVDFQRMSSFQNDVIPHIRNLLSSLCIAISQIMWHPVYILATSRNCI